VQYIKLKNLLDMKYTCLVFTFFILASNNIYAQTCLPDGIVFTTQEQVDSFAINHPDCTEILGDLKIESVDYTNITNLKSLENISIIGGDFWVSGNSALDDFSDLKSLIRIGKDLVIFNNTGIKSLIGLDNIKAIPGNVSISNGGRITTLDGLDNLASIGQNLTIRQNSYLISLENLEKLTSINGDLTIWNNNILSNLKGLENIDFAGIEKLEIRENPMLEECAVKSICSYLENGGANAITGNATGCEAFETILSTCSYISSVFNEALDITIYPNPSSNYFTLSNINTGNYTITNLLGEFIQQGELSPNKKISMATIPKGIYYISVNNESKYFTGKIMKL